MFGVHRHVFSWLPVVWAILLGPWHAYAADLEISIPIQLTHAQNFDAASSPDGKKLVFISMLSGKEQLFTMDADGKNIAQLTRDDADHEDPAWSPDGKKIAFVMITKERTSIAVMNADGVSVDTSPANTNNYVCSERLAIIHLEPISLIVLPN